MRDFDFDGQVRNNNYSKCGATFWEIFKSCGDGIHKADLSVLIPLYEDYHDMLQIVVEISGDTVINHEDYEDFDSAGSTMKNILNDLK